MSVDHASAQPGSSRSSPRPAKSHAVDGTPVNHTTPAHHPEPGPSRGRPLPTTASAATDARPVSPDTSLGSSPRPSTPHLDLATYPTTTLLRLLASLLQQITSANDQLRPPMDSDEKEVVDDPKTEPESSPCSSPSRSSSAAPHPSPTTALFDELPQRTTPFTDDPIPLFSASRRSLTHPSSLLSFHARHVPSISIEAYLLRILKYCPTTNEVFLGLLVYFDRMSRLGTPQGVGGELAGAKRGVGRGFAIDSYNVHRLIIAGVTVASKFFSDVFYTNSRYAKVGGLPSYELNQLELQFLLLNDFRLVILPEELQRYADRLLAYWEGQEGESGAAGESTSREASRSGNGTSGGRGNDDKKTEETTRNHDKMDVDPKPRSTASPPAATTTETAAPAARSSSSSGQAVSPRGKERDSSKVTFSEPSKPSRMSDWKAAASRPSTDPVSAVASAVEG